MRARTIGVLAREVGVNVETIRFYERTGLLKRPPRPPRGWRVYGEEAVWTVRIIRMARRMGFSLRTLGELGEHLRDGSGFCHDFRSTLDRQLAIVERDMSRLADIQAELTRIRARCQACSSHSNCPILGRLPAAKDPECRRAKTSVKS
jgi:MerR family mercuric resistance operon transcriptional regulator